MQGGEGGVGSQITRKENSLSQFHDENKHFLRFTKKNSFKQCNDMYRNILYNLHGLAGKVQIISPN